MAFGPGTRLGAYDILSLIGQGGMGEVYRAKDTKLGREVALKILPATFTNDPDRVARFRREAQVLASLNHAHIGAIYGLDESGGTQFLVLELVDGESLDKRISRGRIPISEALGVARQIAEALEAAHEKGIVHRDLKPANIALTRDGNIKVLDFGLAKAVDSAAGSTVDVTNSPTITSPAMMTGHGVILGTAAYMSPEQAKGLDVDHRSDIFSFGVVLHEMLTGRRAFHGETGAEVLASVLVKEPDLDELSRNVPVSVQDLIRRCLQKNPKKRWQAIGDVRLVLETIADEPIGVRRETTNRPARWGALALAFLAGCVATGIVAWEGRQATPPGAVVRFSVSLGESEPLGFAGRPLLALSPDGSRLAYIVANQRVLVRTLSDTQARPLSGAEDATGINTPVFSPDGQWLAFYSSEAGAIKRVPVTGGAPLTVCVAPTPLGITWDSDTIVYSETATGAVMKVAAGGGAPERLVTLEKGEVAYHPQLLPGGRHLLMSLPAGTGPDRWDKGRIVVQSLATGERRVLVNGGAEGRYLPNGFLIYGVGGVLFAARFDASQLKVVGDSTAVVEGVRRDFGSMNGSTTLQFATSSSGSLAYIPGSVRADANDFVLGLLDRRGHIERLDVASHRYRHPAVSPDGKHIAAEVEEEDDSHIWIHDIAGASSIRQLTVAGRNRYPVWSADSARVVFQSDRGGDLAIFEQRADGMGVATRLTTAAKGDEQVPNAWTPDGKTLLLTVRHDNKFSLWTVTDGKLTRLDFPDAVRSPNPTLSHDGRWMAYQTGGLGGKASIMVQPFPLTGASIPTGTEIGANNPFWSFDDRELYYGLAAGPQLRVKQVRLRPVFTFADLPSLSRAGYVGAGPLAPIRSLDALPDGRFLVVTRKAGLESAAIDTITVVLNWAEDLKRLVPRR
jgi:serine/threonine-protein kinase